MTGILNLLAGSISSAIKDTYFNLVTLLLPGNGTNGAQNNTFLDSSTNNFTITRNGNTTQGTFSPFSQTGWSNYFNGSSDYIYNATGNANLAFGTGDFTVECWVYLTTAPTNVYGAPISVGSTSGGWSINCVTSGSNFYFRWDTFAGSYAITGNYNTNTWYHVAFVRSGTTITCYVNGVSAATSTGYSENLSVSSNLYIGTAAALTTRYQPGYISNIRVVKGTAVYTGSFTPSTTPLTAISGTSLLTCQSNRFLDNSASAIAFTTAGSPSVQAFSPFAPTAAYSASTNGGSGYFDGTGDYLSAASNAAFSFGTGDFTIEFWYYPSVINLTNNCFIDTRNAGGNTTGIFVKVGDGAGGGATTVYAVFGGSTFSASGLVGSAWNHIAVTRNGTTVRVYVNGTSGTSGTSSQNLSDTAMLISKFVDSTNGINGYISGLRLLKGTAQYTGATLTIPTAPPTAITNTQLLLNYTNAGIVDSTAKNVLETVGNAQISTTQSKFGGSSMYFDGTGDVVYAPATIINDLSSGDWTIEGWVNVASFSATGHFIFWNGTTTAYAGIRLGIDTNQKLFFLMSQNGSSWAVNTGAIGNTLSTSTWYHLAITRSGTSVKVFVDGTQVGTTYTVTGSLYAGTLNYVGAINSSGVAQSLNGYIDDLRITKGLARYTANFTAPTAAFALQ